MHLHQIEPKSRVARFVRMSQETYDASPFLDQRIVTVDGSRFDVDLGGLLELSRSSKADLKPAGIIFHHAYACSTLLARCLSGVGGALVLREPDVLHQLAMVAQADLDLDWDELLDLAIRLLSRTFEPSQVPIVKAKSTCNRMIHLLRDRFPAMPALFLYTDLDGFVIASLKDEGRRKWLEAMYRARLSEASAYPELASSAARAQSASDKAAFIWALDVLHFKQAFESPGGEGLVSLYCDRFLAEPAAVLRVVAKYFGVRPSEERIARVLAGPEFNTYSKDFSTEYSKENRELELARLREALRAEILEARQWVGGVLSWDHSMPLPGTLV
jgi:hypothetical protein